MHKLISKAYLYFSIILISLGSCSSWMINPVLAAPTQAEKTVVVGTTGSTKPMNFHDDKGQLTGFEIELLKEVDRRDDQLHFEFELTEFPSLFAGLDSKKFDLVANNLGESKERRQKYLYSLYPYIISHNKLITADPSSKDLTMDDMKGKKFGVVPSSPQAMFLEKYNKANPDKAVQIIYVDTNPPQIIQDVHNGRLDAAIYASTYIHDVEKTYGYKLKASPIANEDAIKPPGSYLIYRIEDKALRDQIDRQLEAIRQDGTLTKISQKYIGQDDTQLTEALIKKNQAYDQAFNKAHPEFKQQQTKSNKRENAQSKTSLFKPSLIPTTLLKLLPYLPITLLMALCSEIIGLILGFLICMAKLKKVPVLNPLLTVFVSFMRGTPQLVQLFLAFYGFPIFVEWLNQQLGTGIQVTQIPPLVYVFIAFGLSEAAYNSEIFRSAVQAVNKTEIEAAYAIGLTSWQTLKRVIVPNALITAIPNLGNSLIRLLKGTSLAFTVTVIDIMGQTRILAGANLRYFEAYVAVALIYWLICITIEWAIHRLEDHLNIDRRFIIHQD
ncbi:ABC transporter substrate-binding protein/permease [Vaginisenegalia massiliensis]|uniref:ABC transporter substrate-binding protein/permease n=1 Tax=Vaginisenegalia massiliensis TaxID=2058294 RepID=UPI001F14A08A|nr:ABC transporter substrate-binding protein/permease [Vaginisenegalia massiliensis]